MLWLSCSFESAIPGKANHVPIHGFLGLWPWSMLSGTHPDSLHPIRDLQKYRTECFILMIVQNKCSVNQHFSKFVLSEISSLRTLWFYHHLCHKLKKAENWQFMYYSMKLSLAAFNGELQSLTGYLVSILKGAKRSTLLHRQDLRLCLAFELQVHSE